MAQDTFCTAQHLKRRPKASHNVAGVKRVCSRSTTVRDTCQINGCKADLSNLREYHRRYKVCELHMLIQTVDIEGVAKRFCQQCGRFQLVADFEPGYRSCRSSLEQHNARRRIKCVASTVAHAQETVACDDASSQLTVAVNTGSVEIESVQAPPVIAACSSIEYQRAMEQAMADEELFEYYNPLSPVSESSYQSSSTRAQTDVFLAEVGYDAQDYWVMNNDVGVSPYMGCVPSHGLLSCATSKSVDVGCNPELVRSAYRTFKETECFDMNSALSLAMSASSMLWHHYFDS